ncbi:MAG: sulfurtransferase TusA family protein [Chloroflexi bacterium]|nr:sulfurtransferase TusA family protein [Chloroflexota bacterium]
MCPMPIANLAKELRKMRAGQVIELVADDPGTRRDIPAWARVTGNELVGADESDGRLRYLIRKGS